jgi:hypothetical protein
MLRPLGGSTVRVGSWGGQGPEENLQGSASRRPLSSGKFEEEIVFSTGSTTELQRLSARLSAEQLHLTGSSS